MLERLMRFLRADGALECARPLELGEARWQPKQNCIFLDFDGVVSIGDSGGFEYLPALACMLERLPACDLVISSDWRLNGTLDEILGYVEPIASRVVGATIDLGTQYRNLELEAWVERYGIRNWAALDDREALFPKGYPRLVHTPYGLRDDQIEGIEAKLRSLLF